MGTGQGRPGRSSIPLFTDHMVLQRDVPTPVWGWTEPGQKVSVTLAGQIGRDHGQRSGQVDGPPRPLPRRRDRTS